MKMPLVSIVMPTLNSGRYVREAIHSLIAQAYPRLELVVVDGGSTDDTLTIVDSYLGDGDLKIIKLEPNLGIARALNVGLAAAEGEFIARMDADDQAYPCRFQKQVLFLVQNPDISLVGGGVDNFGEYEGISRPPRCQVDIENGYLVNNPFYHSTIMIRRKIFDLGVYRYDEAQVCDEDYELWGRVIPKVACANLEQSVLRYRLHQTNGHWDPRKYGAKIKALRGFCETYGASDEILIEALAGFQCSGLVLYEDYKVLRDYARQTVGKKLPKLGWIQDAIVREKTYSEFSSWLSNAQRRAVCALG